MGACTDDVRAACAQIAADARSVRIDRRTRSAVTPVPAARDRRPGASTRCATTSRARRPTSRRTCSRSTRSTSARAGSRRCASGDPRRRVGLLHGRLGLADRFRAHGPVDERRAARAAHRARSPTSLGQTRRPRADGLYAQALRELGALPRRRAARSTSSPTARGLGRAAGRDARGRRWRCSTTAASTSARRSPPNDLALAGVARFDDLDRADDLRRQPRPPRPALRRRARLRRRRSPRTSTPGELLRAGRAGARDPRLRGPRLRAARRARSACRRACSTCGCGTAARRRRYKARPRHRTPHASSTEPASRRRVRPARPAAAGAPRRPLGAAALAARARPARSLERGDPAAESSRIASATGSGRWIQSASGPSGRRAVDADGVAGVADDGASSAARRG